MSDIPSKQEYYWACGVFKLDYRSAGFKDLLEVSKEWSKDPNFYEIIVRGVSSRNFGIQFLYICDYDRNNSDPMRFYKKQLEAKFGTGEGGLYAWDWESSKVSRKELDDNVVVLKDYKNLN